jgi:hypothetical protein
MTSEAIAVLRQQLESVCVQDAEGVLEYIPLSARMAALGEPACLATWRELAREYKDFSAAFADRCREGIWDLEQALGEDLGLAVIEAQDFYCFARREGDLLLPQVRSLLAAWAEHAEEAAIDEEAASVLRDFLTQFPLPRDERLAIVDCPVTELARAFVAAQACPRPTVTARWPAAQIPIPHDELHVAESAGWYAAVPHASADELELCAKFPSDRLKRQFERRLAVDIPLVGAVTVNRSVSDNWEIVIDIELPDGNIPDIDMVRVGLVPLGRTTDDDISRWVACLRPFEHLQRLIIMEQPMTVLFTRGSRLEVT